jgi:UDP-3-O-[3-hydroxymyristoyl] glucosamine N-acyltransferase
MPKITLSELEGKGFIEVVRDGEFKSLGFITISSPSQLAYIEDAKYRTELDNNPTITCVITTYEIAPTIPSTMGVAVSAMPKKTFYEIHNYLAKNTDFYGKPFANRIAKSAAVNPTAYIAPDSVWIGERCEIGAHACILSSSVIGNDVIIGAGVVIGNDGFEFKRIGSKVLRVIHTGGVIIGDRVEIKENSCVSKSLFGAFTEIGEDTKLDNLIHISHNVVIGKRCLIIALAMVGGSAIIGNDVWIGPSASIVPGVVIGDGATVTIGSVVTQNVAPGQRVTGNFAIDHNKFLSFLRTIR